MLDIHPLTYKAVIIVTIPGASQPLEANVELLPADHIQTATGHVKLLPDCTLADLQHFADELESDLWETQQAITLRDLARNVDSWVKIRAYGQPQLDRKQLAQTALFFPDGGITADTTTALDEELAIEELIVLQGDTASNSQAGIDELEIREAINIHTTKTMPAIGVSGQEVAPHIVVSDSEPIYEAREVAELAEPGFRQKAVTADEKNRLAGEKRPLDDLSPYACDILIDEIAFRGTQAHALTSLTREVAGVLVGPHPEKQPNGRYVVHITDYIIARHTRMQGASVTYTPESWRYVNDMMMERYPDEEAVIVGWYHTHPGFGIFLSNMDLFIHHNFFTQKWHIAFVLDPVGKRSGFFAWDRQQNEVLAYPFAWPYWAHRSW